MKILRPFRRAWCFLFHRGASKWQRWTLAPDRETFERHCARCDYGWGRKSARGYTGPVKRDWLGRWRPLKRAGCGVVMELGDPKPCSPDCAVITLLHRPAEPG